jgi:hypothetical protein
MLLKKCNINIVVKVISDNFCYRIASTSSRTFINTKFAGNWDKDIVVYNVE